MAVISAVHLQLRPTVDRGQLHLDATVTTCPCRDELQFSEETTCCVKREGGIWQKIKPPCVLTLLTGVGGSVRPGLNSG